MNARYRDERAAAVRRDASALRIGTIGRSAIGAPNQEDLLADQRVDASSREWRTRSDAFSC